MQQSSWLPLASPLNTDLWLEELLGHEDAALLRDIAFCMTLSWHWQIALFYMLNRILINLQLVQHTKPRMSRLFGAKLHMATMELLTINPLLSVPWELFPNQTPQRFNSYMIALDLLGRPLMVTYSCSSFRFQPLDGAIKILQPNYFMAKIYLPHAYRSVPIEKSNFVPTWP